MWIWPVMFVELNQVQHEYKIAPLVNKLLDLGRAYSSSEITFPVEFLVEILERKSIELKRQWERSRNSFDISWVVNTMLDIGIPHHRLFFAYNDDLLEKTVSHRFLDTPDLTFFLSGSVLERSRQSIPLDWCTLCIIRPMDQAREIR